MPRDSLILKPSKHVSNGSSTTHEFKRTLCEIKQIQQNPRPWNISWRSCTREGPHGEVVSNPSTRRISGLVQVYGTNALQVSDKRGKLHNIHITDVRKINMTEKLQHSYKKLTTTKVEPPNI